MERYIGLDAHASSCTLGIVGPSGKRLGSQVVETNARALIEVLRGIPRNRHLCLEEGTLSGWLYEVLKPHVEELTVAGVGKSRGPKTDKLDAFALAEKLRIGSLETTVYKNRGQFRRLGERAKSYDFLVGDTVRVKNRLKSVLRSRGVAYGAGRSVYLKRDREEWLAKLPEASRTTAGLLYEEHDALVALRAKAEKALLAGGGDAVPVPEPEQVLGVLRTGRRDAELVGLGGSTQASRVACAEDVPGSGSDPDGGAPHHQRQPK